MGLNDVCTPRAPKQLGPANGPCGEFVRYREGK